MNTCARDKLIFITFKLMQFISFCYLMNREKSKWYNWQASEREKKKWKNDWRVDYSHRYNFSSFCLNEQLDQVKCDSMSSFCLTYNNNLYMSSAHIFELRIFRFPWGKWSRWNWEVSRERISSEQYNSKSILTNIRIHTEIDSYALYSRIQCHKLTDHTGNGVNDLAFHWNRL